MLVGKFTYFELMDVYFYIFLTCHQVVFPIKFITIHVNDKITRD